jgi:hypothetical protein
MEPVRMTAHGVQRHKYAGSGDAVKSQTVLLQRSAHTAVRSILNCARQNFEIRLNSNVAVGGRMSAPAEDATVLDRGSIIEVIGSCLTLMLMTTGMINGSSGSGRA